MPLSRTEELAMPLARSDNTSFHGGRGALLGRRPFVPVWLDTVPVELSGTAYGWPAACSTVAGSIRLPSVRAIVGATPHPLRLFACPFRVALLAIKPS